MIDPAYLAVVKRFQVKIIIFLKKILIFGHLVSVAILKLTVLSIIFNQ